MSDAAAVKKLLKEGDSSASVVLLVCPDRVRRDRLEDEILKSRGLQGVSKKVFFGEQLKKSDFDSLWNELFSTSLFAATEVYKVLHLDEMKADTSAVFLEDRFLNPTSNLLILHASTLKSNSRLRKVFKEKNAIFELKELSAREVESWVLEQGEERGLRFGKKVPQLLAEIGGESPDQIAQLLNQVSLYSDGNSDVREQDILYLFQYQPNPDEFALLNLILTKQSHQADINIGTLLEGGKNPFLLLNLLGKAISRLLTIKTLLRQGKSRVDIQSKLKMQSWLLDKDLRMLEKVSPQKLEQLQQAIIAADARLKGRSLGPVPVFSQLVHSL